MTTRETPMSWQERRAAVAACRTALTGFSGALFAEVGTELAGLMTEIDELGALVTAARVAVVEEAETRGEVASSQCAGVRGWVRTHAPSLRHTGQVSAVAKCVTDLADPELAPVKRAVLAGELSPRVGVMIADQFGKISPRLNDGAGPEVLEHMVTFGRQHGAQGVRDLRRAVIGRWGSHGELDREAESNRRFIDLSGFAPVADGVWQARLSVDDESKAVIEAALGPLSKPQPNTDADGNVLERDLRSAGQRRGQALVTVCRRAVATMTRTPSGLKAALYVTMPLADLRAGLGHGETVGAFGAGGLLAPETVRRLACDAGVIPVVLGGAGEILDVGVTQRLFTPGMKKDLWLRDRSCSFPGCTAPAHWCDAHHLIHWLDGGRTAVDNGALLCARHHTIVHAQRLRGWLGDDGHVVWDRVPGSYDRWLTKRRARHPDPPDGHGPDPYSPAA